MSRLFFNCCLHVLAVSPRVHEPIFRNARKPPYRETGKPRCRRRNQSMMHAWKKNALRASVAQLSGQMQRTLHMLAESFPRQWQPLHPVCASPLYCQLLRRHKHPLKVLQSWPQDIASQIKVQLLSQESSGSGTLLSKLNSKTVLLNSLILG